MTDSADRASELRRFLGQFETALRRESYLHFGRILPSAGAAGGGGVRGASSLVYDPVQPEPGETPDVTGGGEVTTTTQPASPATTIPPNPTGTITTTAAGGFIDDLEQQGPGDDAEDDPLFEPPPLYSTVSPGTALAHGIIVSSLRRIFPGLSEGVASDLVNQWAYRQAISQSVLPSFTRTLCEMACR